MKRSADVKPQLISSAALIAPTVAMADPDGTYGSHMHGYGGWFMGPFVWLIVLIAIVCCAYVIFRPSMGRPEEKGPSALDELDMRLARGEIDPEDYEARRKLLSKS
jgi:putative membrane protein